MVKTWFISPVCLLLGSLIFAACSVPNLETPECSAGRDVVKRFYSMHFGSDMHPSVENWEKQRGFLTPGLQTELAKTTDDAIDYFTATDNYPKAFRVGACNSGTASKAEFQVMLFWKNDSGSEQKEVKVEIVKDGDNWLISKVTD